MSTVAAIREEALDRERGHGFGALAVTVLGTFWYALVADALFASHHLDLLLERVWRVAEDPAAVAGQWLAATLLSLTRAVPESGPHTLVLITTLAGGVTLGAFYWRLRRVHWSLAEALAATLLLALHSATLLMATTGQTLLLSVLPLISLLVRPDERERPVTALLALLGGPVAGAGATLFWHTEGTLPSLGIAMAAVVGWTSSRRLSPPERWLWLLWLGIGVVLCWITPWLWGDPIHAAWREALGR